MSMTATKERPILFSGPMVNAIRSGLKTQTRRIVKAPVDFIGAGGRDGGEWDDPGAWGWEDHDNPSHFLTLAREPDPMWCSTPIACPYGQPGDRLWVRETWQSVPFGPHRDWPGCPDLRPRKVCESNRACVVIWRADGEMPGPEIWRPSIFMPRWASRLTLEIAGVRVERLQAISEDDAWAEGFPDPEGRNREYADRARYWFKTLWGEINGKESWDANPWVWVIEFRKIDAQGVSS